MISGITREFARGISDYFGYFTAQVVIDTLLNSMGSGKAGYLVDFGFIVLTLYGFLQELRATISARGLMRFVLAIFALGLDIWLNSTFH